MKKIAFATLFMGMASTGLLACGGGDDDGDDGIMFADSAPVDDACNPVTQDGCADGEKCSWLVVQEDPFLGRTDCVPDGTVAAGGECTEGTPGEETGFDNCAAGNLCIASTCRTICNIDPDSCAEGFACSLYTQTFSDDSAENLGVCDPTCDPVAQDCEVEGQGCYLQVVSGKATCARAGGEDLTQGEQCENDGTRCYLNGCAAGFGAFLFAGESMPNNCTAFCSPVETYLVDPDGDGTGTGPGTGGTNEGSDANGAPPHDCAAGTIGFPGHQCKFFSSFFQDENGNYFPVDNAFGFCTPRGEDYGDCTKYSREWLLETYSQFIEGGGTDAEWGDEITAQCDGNLGCTAGCLTLETRDALDTAYCAVPANVDRPACVEALKSRAIIERSIERISIERMLKNGLLVPKK